MSLRTAFYEFYRRAQRVLAPTLRYSQALYEDTLQASVHHGIAWVDLGCGHNILPPWREEHEKQLAARAGLLVGLDYDAAALAKHCSIHHRVHGDISKLPFVGESFDLVTANMVFEHLKDPEGQLAEIFRVLKPGGRLIFHTPNSYGYGVLIGRLVPERLKMKLIWYLQGRREEDVYPAFYRANTPSVIGRQASNAGFDVEEIRMLVSTPNFIMIPPLMLLELILIRALMKPSLRHWRTNIIAILRKPKCGSEGV